MKYNLIFAIVAFICFSRPAYADSKSRSKVASLPVAAKRCAGLGKVGNIAPFDWKTVSSERPVAKDWVSDGYQQSIGSEGEFRWFASGENSEVYLERSEDGKNFYAPPIPLSSCSTETIGIFTVFKCRSSMLLYNGRHLVSVSVEDYSSPLVKFVEKLKFNNHDAFLIEVGIKAGTAMYIIPREFGKFEPFKCFETSRPLD